MQVVYHYLGMQRLLRLEAMPSVMVRRLADLDAARCDFVFGLMWVCRHRRGREAVVVAGAAKQCSALGWHEERQHGFGGRARQTAAATGESPSATARLPAPAVGTGTCAPSGACLPTG